MPFGRLHEEAAGDSKLLALSDAAWRMWGMGLIYCQKNLTDGFIPAGAIHLWGVRAKRLHLVADELCAPQVPGKAALWEKVEGGYQVHDYLQWNDSKEEILKMRGEAKERIRRFREREKLERERLKGLALQAGELGGVRNALQDGEQHAHDVVRGRGDQEKRKGAALRSYGVFAGSIPRDHLTHAACDPSFSRCVPSAVHAKLVNHLAPKHGGDRAAAGDALHAWYPTVWASLPADFVMGDAFKFWQGRFDQAFASVDPAAPKRPGDVVKSPVASADKTKEYLRQQRQTS